MTTDKAPGKWLLFGGASYYPAGGWGDALAVSDARPTVDAARVAAQALMVREAGGDTWWQLVAPDGTVVIREVADWSSDRQGWKVTHREEKPYTEPARLGADDLRAALAAYETGNYPTVGIVADATGGMMDAAIVLATIVDAARAWLVHLDGQPADDHEPVTTDSFDWLRAMGGMPNDPPPGQPVELSWTIWEKDVHSISGDEPAGFGFTWSSEDGSWWLECWDKGGEQLGIIELEPRATRGAVRALFREMGVVLRTPEKCRGCGKWLNPLADRIADGCPCNSPRGVNHGIVPAYVCTCPVCDPAQTGSARQHPQTPDGCTRELKAAKPPAAP